MQLRDPAQLQKVKTDLERIGAYVVPASDITDLITDLVGSTKSMLLLIVGVVLLVTGLGIFNTVMMATFERKEEFGYLRCVGAQKTHIFELIFLETMLLCVAGVVMGLIGGYVLTFIIDGWIRGFLSYAPAGKTAAARCHGCLDNGGGRLVMGAFAGLYPGYRASRVSPIGAVRNE